MAAVLRENPDSMPSAAKSDRVRSLVLVTDGVLDQNWLARTLATPAGRDADGPRPEPAALEGARGRPGELRGHRPEFSRHAHGSHLREVARRAADGPGRRRPPAMLLVSQGRGRVRGHGLRPGDGGHAAVARRRTARALAVGRLSR